jgi:hypothetical protein
MRAKGRALRGRKVASASSAPYPLPLLSVNNQLP